MYHLLYACYEKSKLRKVRLERKCLTEEKREMLHNLLSIYDLLFGGTLGTWKTKTVYIEL